jgi:hypothetical protein
MKASGQVQYVPVGRLHCNSQEVAFDPKVVRSLQLLCYGMPIRLFVGSEKRKPYVETMSVSISCCPSVPSSAFPRPAISDQTVCRIIIKFDKGDLLKNFSGKSEFL